MAWVKLDDHFVDHPKILAAGPIGLALFVAGLCYANRLLTDGFIPLTYVSRLLPMKHGNGGNSTPKLSQVVNKLCAVGLWESTTLNGESGYLIHDFLKYQPSRKQVTRKRKTNAKRLAQWRLNVTRKETRL